MRTVLTLALATALTLTALVGPAAAFANSATGTQTQTVKCRYRSIEVGPYGWLEATLRRIDVMPPTGMRALSGTQKVAWRFKVHRYVGDTRTTTYTSPWQRSTATTSRSPSFTPMGVDVRLPRLEGDVSLKHVVYRILLIQAWYNPDGSREAYSEGGIDKSRYFVDGEPEGSETGFPGCRALMQRFYPHI
jgi:hypothetical protein